MLALYLFLKISLYIAVCTAGVSMMNLSVKDKVLFGMKWGFIRLALGLVAGIIILMMYSFVASIVKNDAIAYIFSFGLIRYLEWFLLAILISNKYGMNFGKRTQYWILLGMFTSLIIGGFVNHFDLLGNMKFVC